ncbi:MAG: metalloregulator ArsR/SmtB family transcription factor [Pseudomonadota bacterium]
MEIDLFAHLCALSEPLRARLLCALERHELTVGELARALQTPQSTVSRHLKQLLERGWVERRTVGPASLFRLAEPLPAEAARLWAVVGADLGGCAPFSEDLLRVESVLAQRELDSRTFFGQHAASWDALRGELYGAGFLVPTVAALLPSGLRVADLGCGTGELVQALAPSVARVFGVDQEAAMLAVARQRAQGLPNVELLQGALEALPLSAAAVDAALCMLVLHHVEDLPAVLREVARILAPGGRLVVLDMVEHDRQEYRQTMGHRHLGFSEEGLGAVARAAGLVPRSWHRLAPDPAALGPGLFLAVFGRG